MNPTTHQPTESGLNRTQGLEVDLKIVTSAKEERGESDKKYSPVLYSKAMIALIATIVMGVIGAILRLVITSKP